MISRVHMLIHIHLSILYIHATKQNMLLAQSGGTVEYTDCFSAGG